MKFFIRKSVCLFLSFFLSFQTILANEKAYGVEVVDRESKERVFVHTKLLLDHFGGNYNQNEMKASAKELFNVIYRIVDSADSEEKAKRIEKELLSDITDLIKAEMLSENVIIRRVQFEHLESALMGFVKSKNTTTSTKVARTVAGIIAGVVIIKILYRAMADKDYDGNPIWPKDNSGAFFFNGFFSLALGVSGGIIVGGIVDTIMSEKTDSYDFSELEPLLVD